MSLAETRDSLWQHRLRHPCVQLADVLERIPQLHNQAAASLPTCTAAAIDAGVQMLQVAHSALISPAQACKPYMNLSSCQTL